jgi:EthD domain
MASVADGPVTSPVAWTPRRMVTRGSFRAAFAKIPFRTGERHPQIGRRHMVKMVAFFKRKPGMSVEAFQSYWRTTHAGIVLKMPGIRSYVQSHTLLNGYRKGEP